jgi:hypothetical protein
VRAGVHQVADVAADRATVAREQVALVPAAIPRAARRRRGGAGPCPAGWPGPAWTPRAGSAAAPGSGRACGPGRRAAWASAGPSLWVRLVETDSTCASAVGGRRVAADLVGVERRSNLTPAHLTVGRTPSGRVRCSRACRRRSRLLRRHVECHAPPRRSPRAGAVPAPDDELAAAPVGRRRHRVRRGAAPPRGGHWHEFTVTGPFGDPVDARWLELDGVRLPGVRRRVRVAPGAGRTPGARVWPPP